MTVAALVVVVMAAQVAVCGAMIIHVGGNTGWTPDKNYTDWSNRRKLYVDDWLMFWYANGKEQYDVVEVNQSNYESCNGQDFIQNITRGYGRDVFHLTEPKTYYFICSKGNYCRDGMKIAITAHERPSSELLSPAPELVHIRQDQEDDDMLLYHYNNLTNEFESLYNLVTAFVAATDVEGKKVIYPRIKQLVAKMKLYPTKRYGLTYHSLVDHCLVEMAGIFLDVAEDCLENGEIDLVPDKRNVPVEKDGFTLRMRHIFPLKKMQSVLLDCSFDLMQHANHGYRV